MRDSPSGVEEPVLVEEWRADAFSTDPTATIVSVQHDGKDTNGAEEAERRSFLSGCARFQALMISEHVTLLARSLADPLFFGISSTHRQTTLDLPQFEP